MLIVIGTSVSGHYLLRVSTAKGPGALLFLIVLICICMYVGVIYIYI